MINYNDQSINQAREYPETLQGVISWRRDARACSMRGNAVIGPLRGNRCAERLGLRYRVPRRVSGLQRRIATKMASGEKLGYAYPRGMPEFLRLT